MVMWESSQWLLKNILQSISKKELQKKHGKVDRILQYNQNRQIDYLYFAIFNLLPNDKF